MMNLPEVTITSQQPHNNFHITHASIQRRNC